MKTLELNTRITLTGKRFDVILRKDGFILDSESREDEFEANVIYEAARENFNDLGKEEVVRKEEFNDDVRRVWISLVDGCCVEKAPELLEDSYVSFRTDAPTELVEKLMAKYDGTVAFVMDDLIKDQNFTVTK